MLKNFVSRGFDGRIEVLQEEHQQAVQEQDNRIQAIEYESVGLQSKILAKDQQIAALQWRNVGYLVNEDKNNGITIIAKSNEEADYPYISIYGHHGYRRYKTRVLLACNQGSTLFAERDTPNVILSCNFWREHRLIEVDPNRPRHFRLNATFREQLLAMAIHKT